jgi:hypothetical protein
MVSSQVSSESQAQIVESRHRIAVSAASIATTLLRVTRRHRIAGGDGGDKTSELPMLCSICEKTLLRPVEDWVKVDNRLYHMHCWDRMEARHPRHHE